MAGVSSLALDPRRLGVRVDVVLEIDGRPVIDSRTAAILALVEKHGSLLAAARILGIPYSRTWEAIVRAERAIGFRLIEAKRGGRGGGGARLTQDGKKVLEEYMRVYRRVTGREFVVEKPLGGLPDLVYMGSHDPGVEILGGIIRKMGVEHIELSWTGSGLGLAALALGEADLAGIHLLDPETGEYNNPYIKRHWLEGKVALVRGYDREIGFMTRSPMTLEEVLDGLVRGELKLVNRQRGAGTRVLLDTILEKHARKLGIDPETLPRRIRGYEREVETHLDVARMVASGEADVGLGIRWAASHYGLYFTRVTWENFDFVIPLHRMEREPVKKALEALVSKEFRKQLGRLEGYRVPSDIGTRIM